MQEVLSQPHHTGTANETEWKLYNTGMDYQWTCNDDDGTCRMSDVIFAEGMKYDPPTHIMFFKFRCAGTFTLHLVERIANVKQTITFEIL